MLHPASRKDFGLECTCAQCGRVSCFNLNDNAKVLCCNRVVCMDCVQKMLRPIAGISTIPICKACPYCKNSRFRLSVVLYHFCYEHTGSYRPYRRSAGTLKDLTSNLYLIHPSLGDTELVEELKSVQIDLSSPGIRDFPPVTGTAESPGLLAAPVDGKHGDLEPDWRKGPDWIDWFVPDASYGPWYVKEQKKGKTWDPAPTIGVVNDIQKDLDISAGDLNRITSQLTGVQALFQAATKEYLDVTLHQSLPDDNKYHTAYANLKQLQRALEKLQFQQDRKRKYVNDRRLLLISAVLEFRRTAIDAAPSEKVPAPR